MAIFNGSTPVGIDFREFNFAFVIEPLEFFEFFDNVNDVATSEDLPGLPGTFTYSDLIEVWTGSPQLDFATAVASIAGENITWDPASGPGDPLVVDGDDDIIGGTVTGFYFESGLGTINEQWLYLVGFSVSALALDAIVQTPDNADDLVLLQQMLSGDDTIFGSGGSDFYFGGTGHDQIEGDAGRDWLNGDAGNDSLYGGSADDTLQGGAGADLLDGGAGTRDQANYSDAPTGLRADLQVPTFNTGHAAGDVYSAVEDLVGSSHGDTLLGDTGSNMIWGGGGNDVWLDGRIGNDTIYGGDGNDVLIGGAGADHLDGGAGTRDRVQYTDATTGVRADLQVPAFNTGIAAGDTYSGVEDIFGSFRGDTLLGDTGDNIIWGAAGNDVWLDGRIGNDTLYGGDGDDVLIGGWGSDHLDGGAGNRDRAQYTDAATGVRVDLQTSSNNTGIAAGDTYVGIEDVFGSFRDDSISGDAGGNILWGAAGNDVIDGRLGNDLLLGGAGDDTLLGGDGNDTLTGDAGADVFIFDSALGATNVDTITDYSLIDDVIHLESAIFTALTVTGGLAEAAFTIGAAATTAAHRIVHNSATGELFYDADGSGAGAAVHFATFTNGVTLTADEFVII